MKLAEQIEAMRLELRELAGRMQDGAAAAEAFRRFESTGHCALPMTAAQVAAVLNLTCKGVWGLVYRGLLFRRWPGTASPYHPDDVRLYLEGIQKRGEMAEEILTA